MPYAEIEPAPALRSWVVCYWSRTGDAQPVGFRVLPDGCADVIFDLSASRAFAVGTMTRPLLVEEVRREYFAVRFRPGRAAFFLRASLSAITDRTVPLSEMTDGWGSIAERLGACGTVGERVTVLDAALERAIGAVQPEERVDAAVSAILRGRGAASIDHVAEYANLSRQHLGRLFAHHVGVSPKTFARITRFRALLEIGRHNPSSWADTAARLGYADQSHLIAEFRQYAGSTPVPFFLSPRSNRG